MSKVKNTTITTIRKVKYIDFATYRVVVKERDDLKRKHTALALEIAELRELLGRIKPCK